PFRADVVGDVIERAARLDRPAWVLSNHDFGHIGSRIGEHLLPAAATLLLTLPGAVFLYQGDEIGLLDGPGGDPPDDRYGRDRARHPMQWDSGPAGGFSTGTPWLPAVDPATRNVADQRADPDSLYSLHRRLIALRRGLRGGLDVVAVDPDGLLAYRRGDVLVALNLGVRPVAVAPHLPIGPSSGCQLGQVLLATPGAGDGRVLAPGAATIARIA
ncbi:MAG TPA: alpha-amylase family glycosyl hydrolase, partial [Gaiellales bacterium]